MTDFWFWFLLLSVFSDTNWIGVIVCFFVIKFLSEVTNNCVEWDTHLSFSSFLFKVHALWSQYVHKSLTRTRKYKHKVTFSSPWLAHITCTEKQWKKTIEVTASHCIKHLDHSKTLREITARSTCHITQCWSPSLESWSHKSMARVLTLWRHGTRVGYYIIGLAAEAADWYWRFVQF